MRVSGANQRREDGQCEDVVSSRLLLVIESLKKMYNVSILSTEERKGNSMSR